MMKTRIKQYGARLFEICGGIAVLLGIVSCFFSLSTWLDKVRISRLLGLCIILAFALVVSIVWEEIRLRARKTTLYSKGKTKIIVEYNDIKKIVDGAERSGENVTIVIPVNTSVEHVFEQEKGFEKSLHYFSVEYINKYTMEKSISIPLKSLEYKKDGFSEKGRIGDWFLLDSYGRQGEKNIKFFYAEIFELEKKNGRTVAVKPNKESFLYALQSMIEGVVSVVEQKEKIYIPLVGSGKGDCVKEEDVLHLLLGLLRFNKNILRHEVHVVIYDESGSRNDLGICQLHF